MKPIDINRLISIDYTDYIDWFPMIDFHRSGTPGVESLVHPPHRNLILTHSLLEILPEKRVLKLVEWFSGHCRAIES